MCYGYVVLRSLRETDPGSERKLIVVIIIQLSRANATNHIYLSKQELCLCSAAAQLRAKNEIEIIRVIEAVEKGEFKYDFVKNMGLLTILILPLPISLCDRMWNVPSPLL